MPSNAFKRAIAQHQTQIGLWLATADAYVAEMIAGTGYDWLLIDGEHAPNDLRATLAQLQAIGSAADSLPSGVTAPHPVVRLPVGDPVLVKQYMELGVQTLLVPMVDTPEQALGMARAMRYPPEGTRGMGSGLARSSRWLRYPDYIHEANEQACLLVQVESVEALRRIDAIAATPGVDGVFIGPADLSASMGLHGQAHHPDVVGAIRHGFERIHQAGKAAGILATVEGQAHQWIDAGASFVAVGVDISLLSKAAQALAARFPSRITPSASAAGDY
ncbi:2-dehydro-3-deoxyglucarate aldolase [Cupriavidus sp. UME77]|nr:HpcH/HpaI aldolase/citrate lyase family protein [Cupriavidus sp. UME77]MBB1634488.1 2-dehydro-3-deoxyglucarate aldolase [Cupriavidus sp. UME77]